MKLADLIEPFDAEKEEVVYRQYICPSGYVVYIPQRIKKEKNNETDN